MDEKQPFKAKTVLNWISFLHAHSFSLWTLFDGLIICVIFFYQLFQLSFWRHPFTAMYPLESKCWNVKFLQIYSNKEKLIYILDSLRVSAFSANFHFWVNYSTNREDYQWIMTENVSHSFCEKKNNNTTDLESHKEVNNERITKR